MCGACSEHAVESAAVSRESSQQIKVFYIDMWMENSFPTFFFFFFSFLYL